MKVGRNDPCPCGSGRKYKQCCLQASAAPDDLLWHRLRSVLDGQVQDILRFVRGQFGQGLIDEAWHEFMLVEGGPFDPETVHLPVFLPWFLYDWEPDPMNTSVAPERVPEFPVARAFVRARPRLDPLLVRYTESCVESPFSFFDVVACSPGKGFALRDILTGAEHDVTERSASQSGARPGDILYAKVVALDGITVLDGCAPVILPPIDKAPVLELRRLLRRGRRKPTAALLADFDMEIREVYLEAAERLLNPRRPEMRNTDGDPIAFHRVVYAISSAEDAFEALHPLSLDIPKAELLDDATLDAGGALVKVRFSWLKPGNAQHRSWKNTVLGTIDIDGAKLVAEVNSASRAEAFRTVADELLAGKGRYLRTVIQSLESALAEMPPVARGSLGSSERSVDDLNALPEVRAYMDEVQRQHYRDWVHSRIPALRGKTPLQAMRTRDGREMVEALVLAFERGEGPSGNALDPAIVRELRATLAAAAPTRGSAR